MYDEKFEMEAEKKTSFHSFANFQNSEDEEKIYRHYSNYDDQNNVLNGIAYSEKGDFFILTGKMFDHIHKVRLDYQNYVTADPLPVRVP
mgnify:CR=1 FL=1